MGRKKQLCVAVASQKIKDAVNRFLKRRRKTSKKVAKYIRKKKVLIPPNRSVALDKDRIRFVPVVVSLPKDRVETSDGSVIAKKSNFEINLDAFDHSNEDPNVHDPYVAVDSVSTLPAPPSSIESTFTMANKPIGTTGGGSTAGSNPQLKALNNLEVNNLGNDLIGPRKFLGVVARDNIANIVPLKTMPSGFVFNTDIASGGGKHWRSVIIDPRRNKRNIEYYDSFGESPESDITEQLNKLVKKISTQPFQYKINNIKNQNANSETCGWHSLKFLKDRIVDNKPFKEVTGFDEQEDKVKQLANQFDYIGLRANKPPTSA